MVRPAKREDVRYVFENLREQDRYEVESVNPGVPTEVMADVSFDTSAVRIAIEDNGGNVVAVCGLAMLWVGVCSIWFLSTDNVSRVMVSLTRELKKSLMSGLKKMGCHRAEAKSIATHGVAHRWMQILGGTHEATLRKFGRGGENFELFTWIP